MEATAATLKFNAVLAREFATINRAESLLKEYGLYQQGWRFGFNERRNAYGLCVFRTRRIELSHRLYLLMSAEAVEDTLLHELAHALVGSGHGHDKVWKAACLRVGARPERCSALSTSLDGPAAVAAHLAAAKYTLTCPTCQAGHAIHRKPKNNYLCSTCLKKTGLRVRLVLQTNY
jgi:predicted SprT family Zn-dependent metalloprotease